MSLFKKRKPVIAVAPFELIEEVGLKRFLRVVRKARKLGIESFKIQSHQVILLKNTSG